MDEIAKVKSNVKYAEWVSMVRACQSSGLQIKEWCQLNGIVPKTYYYRLRRLREMFLEQNRDLVTPEIKPLPVVKTPSVEAKDITIQLDGISITIPQGTDTDTIANILRAVKTTW